VRLSPRELTERIALVRIGFEMDGSLLLTYDARELFGGHMVDAASMPIARLSEPIWLANQIDDDPEFCFHNIPC
jgi:hypothetical protein